jgi:hypothetical protein
MLELKLPHAWKISFQSKIKVIDVYIILIPGQTVFVISPLCCVLRGEATNTNFIVFGLTLSGLESTIYRPQGEHANHYYTTDAVFGVCVLGV